MSDQTVSHRLHPSSLIFQITSSVRGYLFPVLIMFFFGASDGWRNWELYIFITFSIGVMGMQLMRYMSFRYRFDPDELIVKHGILSRNERHIPFGRIQNIDLVQNPLHRALRVAEIRLQTASGEKPEAVLRVLSMRAVEVMRQRVYQGRESGATSTDDQTRSESATALPTPEVIARLNLGALVRLGVISNRGLIIVGAAVGVVYEFGFGQWENFTSAPIVARIVESSAWAGLGESFDWAEFGLFTIVVGTIVVFALVVALIASSIMFTVLRFHGFKLARVGDGFRISCGLLTRRTATVPAGRIQYISIRQTPVARLLNQVNIRVETAGGSGGNDNNDQTFSSRWFLPILPEKQLQEVLPKILPGLNLPQVQWHPLSARALRRTTIRGIRNWLIISIPVCVFLWPWGLISVILLPMIGALLSRRACKKMAYAATAQAVLFKSGLFSRTTSAAMIDKIQAVSLSESPFDRRWTMATLLVDTAGSGIVKHRVQIRYLDRAVADDLASRLSTQAEAAA